jgi:sarcosine oxidase subunit alpha
MSAPIRRATGGHLNRDVSVRFSLEGKSLTGFQGDTLASALLANNIRLVGRSFKYHRPRGFLAAGVEEPNGLFTIGLGGRSTPNVVGTGVELVDGLIARRQNAWPSVEWDLMAINSLFAPLLSAGFYYKTFMGPFKGSWMWYEPFIRRAAGLGRAEKERDPDRYETRHLHTDVAIIGAGPAGLSAALQAGRQGARVVLIEQDCRLGGSLLSEPAEALTQWRQTIEREIAHLPNITVLTRTTALGLYDGHTLALVERRDATQPDPIRGQAREVVITLRTQALVLASGSIERPLVFGNNDLPGVMLHSAVNTYSERFALQLGSRIVCATNNDSVYASACALARHGANVTIADSRTHVTPALLQLASTAQVRVLTDAQVVHAKGQRHVRAATLAVGQSLASIACDLLTVSGGWNPTVHLSSHTGIAPMYRADIDAFVPGGFAPGHYGAGAVTGCYALSSVIREGAAAGGSAACYAGFQRDVDSLPMPLIEDVGYRLETTRSLRPTSRHKAFLDFQTDVTSDDLTVAYQEGFVSVEHLKRYTTLGMGTDQGKTSNINAIEHMAHLRKLPIPAAGTTTFRPPYTPVSIGALAGRRIGQHFRPIRRTPLHDWHAANGGVFTEAGLWLRVWYYQWAGQSVEAAYLEEMRVVRQAVGLSDVSSLGKIDIQGADAAEFLNRVYVNGFAKLPIGKARYGVMLNDDGTVLDDGTTARFSDTQYFMTTTTAQAAEVMSRLEFLTQMVWPELAVNVTSVTDQWAGLCLAGPKARTVLQQAFPTIDTSDTAIPYMAAIETSLDDLPLRILRLSFSGELAYELYIPAEYGHALWQHLLAAGASSGIKPYGLEALASLRIEKGHVAGLELDHRTTLSDLGLAKMARPDKAYIGQALSDRPGLTAADRWSLVGLRLSIAGPPLRGGAILFFKDDALVGHGRGYITSVTWSIELNQYIALALLQGGLGHEGEEIVCVYPLKREQVHARVVSPVFIDAAGARLRV